MREDQIDPFGLPRDIRRDLRRVRRSGMIREQNAVPAVVLVGAGQPPGVIQIKAAPDLG